jgi:hypothetical protein
MLTNEYENRAYYSQLIADGFLSGIKQHAVNLKRNEPDLADQITTASNFIEYLLAENKRLLAALAPFAQEADQYRNLDPHTISVTNESDSQPRETCYSIADLRYAEELVSNHPSVKHEPVCWLYETQCGTVEFAEENDEDVYSFPVYRHSR